MLQRALCLAVFCTGLWAADPFLATWKLNLKQSKFEPGPAPQSMTVVWTQEGVGVKVTTTGFSSNGNPLHEEYVAHYNGLETSKKGPWNFDVVINRQISEREREDIFKKRGAIQGTSKLIVSEDGRQLTVTWKYGELRDVRVFDREP
jgi:hypothetical protein